jgi:hypothetical protein
MADDNLVAKSLRQKCDKDVKRMIGNIENLDEICDTLDMCYERPEKYRTALKPKIEYRQYKMRIAWPSGISTLY